VLLYFDLKVLHLLGIGDWGLGIGDWANPQSPIPKIHATNNTTKIIKSYLKLRKNT